MRAFRSILVSLVALAAFSSSAQQGSSNANEGLSPSAAYNAGDIDNVNVASGTVMLQIPLLSYPQRGKLLRMNFKIYYNNANWFITNWPQPTEANAPRNAPVWKFAYDLYNQSGTSTLGGAYVARDQHLSYGGDSNTLYYDQGNQESYANQTATSTYSSQFIREPNGAKHYYADYEDIYCSGGSQNTCAYHPDHLSPTLYAAHDGTGFFPTQADNYNGRASLITGPDGVSYSTNNQGFETITDTSGNTITSSSSGWTDSLGRFIPGSTSGPGTATGNDPGVGSSGDDLIPGVSSAVPATCSGAAHARQWVVPSLGGSNQTYYLCYSVFQYHTAFNVNGVYGGNYYSAVHESGNGKAELLSAIILPNGQKYTFDYDNYLSLTQIATPTGATIQYTWQPVITPSSTGSTPMGRVLQSRTITPGGNQLPRTYTYLWNVATTTSYGVTFPTSPIYTVVTDPSNNDTEYQVGGSDMSNVIVSQASYSGCSPHHTNCSGNSTLLKTVQYGYSPLVSGSPQFPMPSYYAGAHSIGQPTSITTTLDNGQTTQITRNRTSGYGSCQVTTYQKYQGNSFTQQTRTVSNCNRMDQTASESVTDYGSSSPGPVIKTTNTCYQWENNSAYLSANLMLLPQAITTIAGSSNDQTAQRCTTGTIASQTQYLYDESPSPQGAPRGNATTVIQGVAGDNQPAVHTAFNSQGMPYQTTDANGNTPTTYTYDNTGTFLSEVDYPTVNGVQHIEHFSYDGNTGRLLSRTDQNSKVTSYSYIDPLTNQNDLLNRLHKITYPATQDGTSGTPQSAYTQYTYTDTPGSLSLTEVKPQSIAQGVQQQTTTYFDNLGEATQTATVEDSGHTLYVDTHYDLSGRVESVTNPYRTSSDPTYGSTTFGYDALGRKRTETHSGDSSQHVLSYSGSTTTEIDESGVTWVRNADALGRMTSVQEAGNGSDPRNLNTSYIYDILGNLKTVTQTGSGTDGTRVRSFSYDSLSRLIWANNPETGLICYGKLLGGYALGDPNGCSRIYGYDLNGNMMYKTDARGVRIRYDYDALNRLISRSFPGSDPISRATLPAFFTYDVAAGRSISNAVGRLVTEGTGTPSSPVTERLILNYDALGRVLEEKQCSSSTQCSNPVADIQYTYDLLGSVTSSTNGVSSQPITLSYAHDRLERLTNLNSSWSDSSHPASLFAPPSTGTQYSPAGLLSAQMGIPSGAQQALYGQQRTYDARLRLVGETNSYSGTSGVPSSGTITIAGGEQQANGQPAQATGTVTIDGAEGFTVNCGGQPNPNGSTKTGGGQTNTPVNCTKDYDQGQISIVVGSFTASTFYGQGSTRTNVASRLASALNASGSPVTASLNSNVISIVSNATGTSANYYLYSESDGDFNGTTSGSTLTGGRDGGPVYDSGTVTAVVNGTSASTVFTTSSTPQSIAGALASVMQSADGSFLTATASGSTVQLASTSGGSSTNYPVSVSVTYDTADFSHASFSVAANGMSGGAAGTVLYAYTIPQGGYAPNGNLLQVDDTVMGHWTYGYDGLNRLTSGQASAGTQNGQAYYGSAQLSWAYDSFGNYQGQTVSGSTSASFMQFPPYDYSGNSRNQIGNPNYSYDASGNTTHDLTTTYTYDAENRLSSVMEANTTYTYDAEGRRVAKLNAGTPTNFYLLGLGGEQVSELDGGGNWLRTTVYGTGKEIAAYDASGLHFQFTDWLGTRRAVASGSGQLEEICRSLPYGDNLQCTSPNGSGVSSSLGNNHHFTDKERDGESGLDYLEARYLSSNAGRFTSPDDDSDQDPANPQSWNLYSYVRNSPSDRVDPDGHSVRVCDYSSGGCHTLSNQEYEGAQQAHNQGLNVPSVAAVGGNGDGFGNFNETNITDANNRVVGTATYVSDGNLDYYAHRRGYSELANSASVVNEAASLEFDVAGVFFPFTHLTAALLSGRYHAGVTAAAISRKPGTLGQFGDNSRENKIAREIVQKLGLDKDGEKIVHSLLQEGSQLAEKPLTFRKGLNYVREALGLIE